MERKPRKQKKKFTIMVVPHSNSAIKRLNLPMWLVNGLAIFGLISFIVVTYLSFSYLKYQLTLEENKELKTVNSSQAKEIQELQKTTQETLNKLEEIVKTDEKVRELVGLKKTTNEEENDVSRGNGGPATSVRSIQTLAVAEATLLDEIKGDISKESQDFQTAYQYQLDKQSGFNAIDNIKQNLAEINSIIAEQEKVLAKLEVDVKNRLDYLEAIPNAYPVRGRITSEFGWRKNPFTHRSWEFHEGLDIATSYGTPVKAAGGGRVIFTGWKPAYGYTVVIKHGYGYVSQYAHNSRITVKVGQVVKRGDIIARVGSTGRSTGPHVDFRITYNGKWIDPLKLLNK